MNNSFDQIWNRIKSETDLRSFSDLGTVIGKTQQTISYSKKKNEFSAEWAYSVAVKYGLLTEWIMTGKGPKNNFEEENNENVLEICSQINLWLKEMISKEPNRKEWFELQFQDAFPGFKKWKQEKQEDEPETGNSNRQK